MTFLSDEITRLSTGTPHDVAEIMTYLKPTRLAKGQFLLRAGQVCCQYYFVERGAVRLFYYKGADDYTVWIGTAGEIFTDLESYLSQAESRIYIEAIEPSVVYTIDKNDSDRLAQTSNAYNTLLRKTVEKAFVHLSRNLISFQSDEALERYRRLETEKNWLALYPLKFISSFIGITQSSLSRIRAKRS